MKIKLSTLLGVAFVTLLLLTGCAESDKENSNAQVNDSVTFDAYAKEVFICLEDSEPFTLVDVEITDQYPEKMVSFEGLLTP